jgi:hypothetical protein
MAQPKGKSKQLRKPAAKGYSKKKHKVTNWHDYNEALKRRGSLEVWVEEGLADGWFETPEDGKRKVGGQKKYSDLAVITTLQFGIVFHQKLRQTEGFVTDVFKGMCLDLAVPDFSTLSRRGATVAVTLPITTKEKVIAILDSSGLKLYGEGEWKVKKHGWSKHRSWRKVHIDIDADGEIRVVALTGNNVSDNQAAPGLLTEETATIDALVGDGGYDRRNVYAAGTTLGITQFRIPPQKNAKIFSHGNSHAPAHPRDENLREIRRTTRKRWKERITYHVRSLVENTFFRWKTILGERLQARKFAQQVTETRIKAGILNKMWRMGMPQTVVVT